MKNKRMRWVSRAVYGLLAAVLVLLLAALFLRENTVVTNHRDNESFGQVENVLRTDGADTGDTEFSFTLDAALPHDTNLAFYVSHQWVQVYVGDELVYTLTPSGELNFIKTAGGEWVRIPVYREDGGKTVRVVLSPCYADNREDELEVYMGSTLAIYRHEFQKALPAILLSLVNILVGILLLVVAIYSRTIQRHGRDILPLSLLGMVLGLWQLAHNDFSPFLVEGKAIFLYYLSVTMMLVCMVPLIRSAGSENRLLRWYCLAVAAMGIVQMVLQLLGLVDLREMFTWTHGSIILGAALMIVSGLRERRKDKKSSRHAWILAVGALGDLVIYYITGSSSGLLLILSAVLCFMLLEGMGFLTAYTRQQKLLAETAMQLENSRMLTMMSQIRSHFVFNILNAISGMCKYDPEKADETVVRFARYLRNNIDIMEDDNMLPFPVILQHLEDYVALEQVRFGDRIEFVTDLEVVDFQMPQLVLQPIVENAIKHGLTTKPGGGTILVSTWEENGNIQIAVDDDGLGFDTSLPPREKSVGLKNIRFRLQQLVQGTLTIESTPGKGTKATITIPRKEK